ncbi:ANTAR domain-containing response regulator [Paenibacillus solisilvae]|uniref:ANTAR domain-containing response regulator n=1 Tax=Paenibacillus solisilvae TaxID=2486751 RepID=A0ABW0W8V7_9BACL
MRSLLVIDNQASPPASRPPDQESETQSPETILEANGYYIYQASIEEQAKQLIDEADGIILDLPLGEIKVWASKLLRWKRVPMLWWCSASTAGMSAAFCEEDLPIDGILTPSMSEQELNWALHFGSKQCMERMQWQNERKQLEARLEERKWIDMAKGILSKIKNVSEAEAYELLRKQAMNDRKRMVDVATSIVKVYQLLQEQK